MGLTCGVAGCAAPDDAPDDPTAAASAALLDQLVPPVAYDNAQKQFVWGQSFVAVDASFGGVRLYIGDPTRPTLSTVNALRGPADVVFYDISDLARPRALTRERFLGWNETRFGLTTITLDRAVSTVVGGKYFWGIDAACDSYGLGLQALEQSTYPDGAESTLARATGVVAENPLGRDVSFQVFPGSVVATPAHHPYVPPRSRLRAGAD